MQNMASEDAPLFNQVPLRKAAFVSGCLRGKKWNKKTLILAAVLSVFFNLFFYKTCVAFYNDEIGYTSNFFGPAINTYWARWL
jgi:hypothetical protein